MNYFINFTFSNTPLFHKLICTVIYVVVVVVVVVVDVDVDVVVVLVESVVGTLA